MTQKLPSDFIFAKYGYKLRLVDINDAAFIVKLRTNKKTSSFLHTTDPSVEKQEDWIREYKKRESRGEDYYFILEKDHIGYGLIRMYSIHETTFTLGSWTMIDDAPLDSIVLSALMAREVAFEVLGMEMEDSYDGVNVKNKKVLKFNLSWGMKPGEHYNNELGEFIPLSLTKEDYLIAKKKKLRQIGIL